MASGYVFKAVDQRAVTTMQDGSNLPTPRVGRWRYEKSVPDLAMVGFEFDPWAFKRAGYYVWWSPTS